MKENSIERDIHLLESYAGMTHKMNDNQGRPKLDQAIEHILSDYKRVLKENEELKNKLNLKQFNINVVYNDYLEKLNEYKENSIPIQKAKNKIEHYQKLQHNYIEKYDEINEGLQAMISALQELIEEREEK